MKNKRTTYLAIKINYDHEQTNPQALADSFIVLIYNGMGEFPVLDKHGEIEVGEFFVMRDEAAK